MYAYSFSKRLLQRAFKFQMSQKKASKSTPAATASKKSGSCGKSESREAIEEDKDGNINLNIHAKPGSKDNGIIGEIFMPDQPKLDVKISARAVESQANAALIEFIASVLGVKKGACSITKGMKSREKTISVRSGAISLDEAKEKIKKEIDNHKE